MQKAHGKIFKDEVLKDRAAQHVIHRCFAVSPVLIDLLHLCMQYFLYFCSECLLNKIDTSGRDHCAVFGCDNDRRYPERYIKFFIIQTLVYNWQYQCQ